jgi:hypothetical protein
MLCDLDGRLPLELNGTAVVIAETFARIAIARCAGAFSCLGQAQGLPAAGVWGKVCLWPVLLFSGGRGWMEPRATAKTLICRRDLRRFADAKFWRQVAKLLRTCVAE